MLATLATTLAVALRDGVPWICPDPWLAAPPTISVALSAVLGVLLAAFIVVSTRLAVAHFAWARRLHTDLRPVARDMTMAHILVLAGLSSLGEEFLFRGLLVPVLGVSAAAGVFGLVHQIKGPSRWVWTGWAMVTGSALGAIFAATGSLVGPLLAHAIINMVNLTYLRDHDPAYESD